jgi:hypothetical protein
MTTAVLIVVLGSAAVAFLIRFFIALSMDWPKEKCHVVRISRPAAETPWPSLRSQSELLFQDEEFVGSNAESWRARPCAAPSRAVRRAR